MQKTNIAPEILQPFFESAANAAEKGQSQFFTPVEFAAILAAGLPKTRPALVDLNCGIGNLLQASATPETIWLFGADIDPCRIQSPKPKVQSPKSDFRPETLDERLKPALPVKRITCDATKLYPLLHDVSFLADLFVLNPPWRLYWYRDRLAALAHSEVPAVRMAFKEKESRATGMPDACIDSTIATLMMALDRCTSYGEGYLIANNATLERLLFKEGAVHGALARHIWLHLVIPGNPMTGLDVCKWHDKADASPNETEFKTGVIYFARDHTTGPKTLNLNLPLNLMPAELAAARAYRQGAEIRTAHFCNNDQPEYWQAVKERVAELEGKESKVPWNLWLNAGGRIKTALSLYETKSRKVDKAQVDRLFALNDQRPMELVLQRATRDDLLDVAERQGWRVQPVLLQAVRQAIHQYHAARAPLYPLPEIQRLGYLDEADAIECKLDLLNADGRLIFEQGNSYPLRTQTVGVTRTTSKPNAFTGENEELEFTGQELAIFLSDAPKQNGEFIGKSEVDSDEFCFMDAKLKADKKTEVHLAKRQKKGSKPSAADQVTIDFTLQELCAHFIIPDVPDVATVNPAGYNQFLDRLNDLEQITEQVA